MPAVSGLSARTLDSPFPGSGAQRRTSPRARTYGA